MLRRRVIPCLDVSGGRVAGAQFHPERSSAAGLQMLRGFLRWSDAA